MPSVAIIGANGFVGSALREALSKMEGLDLTPVTRSNYDEMRSGHYDILINSAMPSGRFWAKSNPYEDFQETVKKTADLLYTWRFKKVIQISTLSARSQPDTMYGKHKAAAEVLCKDYDHLIVRLGPMYSETLAKGVLIDMLNNRKVYVDGNSRYGFAPLEFVASWVANNLNKRGLVEVGAKNSVPLLNIAHYLKIPPNFEGPIDDQEVENAQADFPDARDVFCYLDRMKSQPRRA